MTEKHIPNYFVYGEPVRALDVGFLHVEMISDRKNLHRGVVSAHKHPQMAQITYWTKGGGTYQIEDSSWTFSAPAISFVSSGVVHGFTVRQASDAIVVSISNDALDRILALQSAPPPYSVFLDKQVTKQGWSKFASTMGMLQQEYVTAGSNTHSPVLHLAGMAIALISRHEMAAEIQKPAPLAQRLRQLVDRDFREPHTVEDYVGELRTTYHLLDKAAKTAFGVPVKQLILQRRLLEAKRLLQFTIRSADDIARELGFKDPAYFNRQFKTLTGQAPGIWRSSRM